MPGVAPSRRAQPRLGVPGVEHRARGGDGGETGGDGRDGAESVTARTLPSAGRAPDGRSRAAARRLGSRERLPAAGPLRRRPHADPRAGRRPVGVGRPSRRSPTPSRPRCAALGGLEVERVGDAVLARTNLDLPTPASCSPGTSTPCRSPTTCPAGCDEVDGTAALRLRHQRHEVRRRRDAAAGRPVRRPRCRSPRTTSRSSSTTTRRSSARRTASAGWRASSAAGSTATSRS